MRILAIAVAGLALLVPEVARADKRSDLQSAGEKAAKEGRYADAIDAFKKADEHEKRAAHACLISLAYTRRELWSQAQLWMAKCHARASASDPMPDWVPQAEQLIADRLKTANVVPVEIDVTPEGSDAEVTVSSFAPDEVFQPRTIYLPPGTHVIFAKVDGVTKQETLQIDPQDKKPRKVVIDFSPGSSSTPERGDDGGERVMQPPPERPTKQPSNTLSTTLLVGGGVATALGVVFHVSMASARTDMADATDGYKRGAISFNTATEAYNAAESKFESRRTLTIASYAVGAGLLITGYLVRHKHTSTETTVTALPLPEGGGFVSIGWQR